MADKAFLDVEEIPNINRKIRMYIKEEKMNNDDIISTMSETTYYYKTNNTNKLNNLINDLGRNFSKINKIHNNNAIVYDKNVEKYNNQEKKTSQEFGQLGGN